VLIYLQLIDRSIEIVADRASMPKCRNRSGRDLPAHGSAFRDDRFELGALTAIEEITALLAQHFPARRQSRRIADSP